MVGRWGVIVLTNLVAACAAAAQLSYVEQSRVVRAVPDDDPPPTEVVRGPESQEAPDFGPFAGSIDVAYYWGQPGYDYGGVAKVVQNSTLAPTGATASGSVYASGDTVRTRGESLLTTTFDVADDTAYSLTMRYEYQDEARV